MRKIRTIICFIICMVVIVTHKNTIYAEEDNLNLYAQSAVLMDADSGRILYAKNSDVFMANVSTTKILTCIVALEQGELEDYAEITANAASMPKVRLGVSEGEYYKLRDLLYALMLESYNDAAMAIAEHIGGSRDGFSELMNRKATEIGCKNTYFITPNGLDAVVNVDGTEQAHGTTAEDLARIMAYCVWESPAREQFLQITQAHTYQLNNYKKADDGSFSTGSRNFSCANHNAFLTMMDGVVSGKTGFTNKAGYCYVCAFDRDNKHYTLSLLACGWPNNRTYKWKDATKLLQFGMEHFQYKNILQDIATEPVTVIGGIGETVFSKTTVVDTRAEQEHQPSLEVLMGDEDVVKTQTSLEKHNQAPVAIGTVVGSVTYYLNDEKICSFPVKTTEAIPVRDYWYVLSFLWKNFSL
ncbi:MAG: D-alanyl-D-alanine carboxypeptidase [Lachnospiraceae bacterium]|nr:D-alanyl-D-alanine carboxypeptidase [Lachnospiraceae bacterium]